MKFPSALIGGLILLSNIGDVSSAALNSDGESLKMFYDEEDAPPRDNGCAVKPDVYYYIIAHTSKMLIGVSGDSRDNAANIVQRKPNMSDPRHSSKWYFRPINDDEQSGTEGNGKSLFYIVNKFRDKYMEVTGESMDDKARLQQNSFTGHTNQQFQLVPDTRYGHCRLIVAHSRKAVTSTDDARRPETVLVQSRDEADRPGQRRRLEEVDCDPHPRQIYYVEEREGVKSLRLVSNDADDRKSDRLEATAVNMGDQQSKARFRFDQIGHRFQGGRGDEDADDASSTNEILYRIGLVDPLADEDRVLQVSENASLYLAPVNEKDDGGQHFYFAPKAKNHACEIKSYKYERFFLTADKTGRVGVSENRNHKGTQWRLIPADFELEFNPDVAYSIRNRQTGSYMDVSRGYGPNPSSTRPTPPSHPRQHFQFKKIPRQCQVYRIESIGSSSVFDSSTNRSIEQAPERANDPWQMFKMINLWREITGDDQARNVRGVVVIVGVMSEKSLKPELESGYEIDVIQAKVDYADPGHQWEIIG